MHAHPSQENDRSAMKVHYKCGREIKMSANRLLDGCTGCVNRAEMTKRALFSMNAL